MLLLVEDEGETLPAIVRETRVTGDERNVERHSMGYDYMVTGVFVVLCSVDAQSRISLHHLFLCRAGIS